MTKVKQVREHDGEIADKGKRIGARETKATKTKWTREEENELAVWCDEQRFAYWDNSLTQEQITKLEALPGWSWIPEGAEEHLKAHSLTADTSWETTDVLNKEGGES